MYYLYLYICFLLHISEVFIDNFIKYIFDPFSFYSSGTPVIQMLVCPMT